MIWVDDYRVFWSEKTCWKDGQDPRLPLPSTKSIAALQAVLAAEMSHLRLWEHIWRTRQAAPFALILEDDARIPRNLEQHLAWLREIPEDCDMVMLGYYLMCYTDGNLTQSCDRDSHEYRDFVRIEKAVSEGGTQKALVHGPARFAGAHAYLVKVESIPRLLRHVEHIRDQVLANSSLPLKMMGTDYATDFGKDCRKYVRSPPTIQQAHDLYKTQIPTRIWMKFEEHRGQVADVSFEFSAGSIMLIGASLLALFAMSSSRFQTSCRGGDDPVVQTFLGEEPM